jgi:chemotaxis signal transduction protein
MKSAVRFSVGGYQFVIDVALVQEVLPANGSCLSADYYSWRDSNLPVIYLPDQLGCQAAGQQPMVISNSQQDPDTLFLLVVERVHGLVDLPADQQSSLPTTLEGIQNIVESVWQIAGPELLLLGLRFPVTDWFKPEGLREQS